MTHKAEEIIIKLQLEQAQRFLDGAISYWSDYRVTGGYLDLTVAQMDSVISTLVTAKQEILKLRD
jgi:hypothetical protein